MTPLSISFVCYPPNEPQHQGALTARCSRFISELGQHIHSPLTTYNRLHEAPGSDFIVLSGADARAALESYPIDAQPGFARRLIPINASRPRILERLLEPLSVPCAVDAMSLAEWEQTDASQLGARGIYGLREVGKAVGATCLLFESERYCFLQSAVHNGLPHLLASYLTALLHYRTTASNTPGV
jgi:hypothetical protein